MKPIALKILLVLSFLFHQKIYANDTQYLIQEMEKLRDSLSLDDPARIDLTLRLADLYFDASIKEGDKEGDPKVLRRQRLKALDLYKHSLNGTDGVKKVTGLDRVKIQFQMGRLLSRLGEYKDAEQYYLSVEKNKLTPKRMREQASLALGEWYEEDAKYGKAVVYYDKALALCAAKATCNYAHYRKGWLYFKDTKLDKAIAEMKASLWVVDPVNGKGGEIRESSLQDLMLFMSNADTDGEKELVYTRKLSAQIHRPELVRQLVEAFYVAGNRRAGSHLLAYINSEKPNLYYEVRLLEEFYGFRKWEKVEKYLKELKGRTAADLPQKGPKAKEEREEINKILRRYLVQVDSEAEVIPELNPFLKNSIDIYLTIYPNDDLRKKLQQGWLKAESDEKAKIARLGTWIKEDIALGVKPAEIRKLRQTRLSMAQKLKMSDVVIEEAQAIAAILKGTPEADEFTYVAAREYYGKKDYDKALPLFKSLVDQSVEAKAITNWSLLSQNLVLDIFNQKKDYDSIIAQVALWKGLTAVADMSAVNKDKKLKKELAADSAQMDKIQVDARFEKAAKLTDSPESLQAFYDFCFQGVYPDKSCLNAKVLAVKFGDQGKLVSLLEKAGDEKALMTEYELMGRYADAAKLQEKLVLKKQGRKAPHELYLKIALLYELDEKFADRNRVLKSMVRKIKREKKIPKELEGAIFLTLDEAGMIDSKSLFLPWSMKRKLSLANRLEMEKPSKTTKKLLLSQKESQGPVWSKLILKGIEKKLAGVNKIKFYGRHSKWLFKKRTRAIDRFVSLAKPKLDGADLETRIYLLHMITRVYGKMTEDILSTPLPPDLDAETMAQVQMQLQGMAAPFEKVREDYQRLLDEQMASFDVKDPKQLASKERIAKNIDEIRGTEYSAFIELEPVHKANVIASNYEGVAEMKATLLKEPNNLDALKALQKYFEDNDMRRLSAYYQGRLETASPKTKETTEQTKVDSPVKEEGKDTI